MKLFSVIVLILLQQSGLSLQRRLSRFVIRRTPPSAVPRSLYSGSHSAMSPDIPIAAAHIGPKKRASR